MAKQVTVYSKPDCMQCKFTKGWLDQNNVAYESVDVTADEKALEYVKDELGYQAVPVVVTDTEHWYGFRPEKLAKLVSD